MQCTRIGLPVPEGKWTAHVHSVFEHCVNLAVNGSEKLTVIHTFENIMLPGSYYTEGLDTSIFRTGEAVSGDRDGIRGDRWQITIMKDCRHENLMLETDTKGFCGGGIQQAVFWTLLKQKRSMLTVPTEVYQQVSQRLESNINAFFNALSASHQDAAEQAVRACIGLGFGLTPSGDDMLSGILGFLRVYDQEGFQMAARLVRKAADRTNDISRSYLLWACEGYGSDLMRKTIHAVGSGSTDTKPALQLVKIGHTSGTDLLEGILRAAEYKEMITV